jgi:pimeloyl-ACP methyl ester carboxylesterase
VKPPYILVGHSIGGIYARKFTDSYPVSGLVFVDSADEEQVWRFERISDSLLFEYPAWPDVNKLAQAGFLPPGSLLKWHHDIPLIVLEEGIMWPQGTSRG